MKLFFQPNRAIDLGVRLIPINIWQKPFAVPHHLSLEQGSALQPSQPSFEHRLDVHEALEGMFLFPRIDTSSHVRVR